MNQGYRFNTPLASLFQQYTSWAVVRWVNDYSDGAKERKSDLVRQKRRRLYIGLLEKIHYPISGSFRGRVRKPRVHIGQLRSFTITMNRAA
jgi:hypothetical protein